ncbi:uncharacterized protein LOC131436611 isoform X1 [Malaya genurostris]|uniref:uncharacterized protein LOC131436611 isoform X1 n=1 Tax=Malaya genurostris TaxID=325434 RepID=UPI0026F3834F|nr:uncharacterized protein LOC131436611 isoform X1 [Malaya genurostris]
MEVAWRFRIIFAMAFAVIIFGDLLGYGGAKKDQQDKSLLTGFSAGFTSSSSSSSNSGQSRIESNARSNNENEISSAEGEISTRRSYNGADSSALNSAQFDTVASKERLKNSLREACLPKLLCEMAAKPNYSLNVRERDLLSLIRAIRRLGFFSRAGSSTTLSLTMAVSPTKWHFAAHMGQLLRDAGDSLVTPMGCSHLWPSCPYSSKKLLKLSNVVQLK